MHCFPLALVISHRFADDTGSPEPRHTSRACIVCSFWPLRNLSSQLTVFLSLSGSTHSFFRRYTLRLQRVKTGDASCRPLACTTPMLTALPRAENNCLSSGRSIMFLRNYVVLPATEELLFRCCRASLLIPVLGALKTLWATPLFLRRGGVVKAMKQRVTPLCCARCAGGRARRCTSRRDVDVLL